MMSAPYNTHLNNNMPIRPELLSPAGDWESLTAAIANGADAVYLGTNAFSARAYAHNFSLTELERAVKYSHEHGVRLYVTLNTLIKNEEIKRFFDLLSRIYLLGVDGVIIQHLSFLAPIKNNHPGLAVFLSTQAALGNKAGISLAQQADRIVLPRELSLDQVKEVITAGVPVEVFVHGALCYSYSGLCLFSSFVSNRSGNRGTCAQLCRQKYNGCYPLSTRELCLARRIPELITAGVTGFKIEGRMRTPLYVAVTTRLYRKAIDSALAGKFILPQKELEEIAVVFSREFTEGFLGNDQPLISSEKPMNRGAYLGTIKEGTILLQRAVRQGDGIGIWQDGKVSGTVVRFLKNNGKNTKAAAAGETISFEMDLPEMTRVYLTASPTIKITPDFTLHRTPLTVPPRKTVSIKLPVVPVKNPAVIKILVKVYSLQEAEESLRAGADIVFYDLFAADFPTRGTGKSIGAYIPRILTDHQLVQAMALLSQKAPPAVLTGNAGLLAFRNKFDLPLYLDYSFNVFNDLDSHYFEHFTAIPIISPELSLPELISLRNKNIVVFCHGDIVLMNTMIAIKEKELSDEKDNLFPVRQEGNYTQILNSRPFGLFNDIRKLYDAGFRFYFIDKPGEGARFASLYRDILNGANAGRTVRRGYTAGHLYRPVI